MGGGAEERRPSPDDGPPFAELRAVSAEDELIGQVIALGDAERRWLNILTPDAWREYAQRGTLLAAVDWSPDGPRVAAYAVYRLPREEVVLAQLVVAPHARQRGLARLLVDRIGAVHHQRRGIRARCRRDYPANAMWPALNFVALGDTPGRSASGLLLTTWWRDHGQEDLLTWDGGRPGRLPVVLDANVFFDLHAERGADASTAEILLDSLEGRVELLVTPEVHNEIDRGRDDAARSLLHSVADTYPRLSGTQEHVETAAAALAAAGAPTARTRRDRSDIRHVAYAVAAGAAVLVTRDVGAISRIGPAAAAAGVHMVTPQDLVALVDETEDAPAYDPASLLGTGYAVREASSTDRAAVRTFLASAAGETVGDFRLRAGALSRARPASHRLIVLDPAGQSVALVGTLPAEGALLVPILRLRAVALRATIAAQLISRLRVLAAEAGKPVVRITDPHVEGDLADAALSDGFRRTQSGQLAALTLTAHGPARDVAAAARRSLSADPELFNAFAPLLRTLEALPGQPAQRSAAAAAEHQIRPAKVTDADLPSYIVPIRPRWSSQLFGVPEQLFARPNPSG